MTDFHCFNIPNFNLKGDYNSKIFSFIEIDIRLNQTRYKENRINLDKFKFNFLFLDNIINYKNGFYYNSTRSLHSIHLNGFYEYFNIYFSPLEIKVDRDLFIRNYKSVPTFRYSQLEKGLLTNNEEKNKIESHLSRFFIRVDNQKEYIDISYKKIPELLSNLLALHSSIFFIFNLIFSKWNSFKSKQYIFSRVFKNKDLFYTNFKNFKDVCRVEKPSRDLANFNINQDRLFIENKEKSSKEKIKKKTHDHGGFSLKKSYYLKDPEMIDLSCYSKKYIELSPNIISVIKNNKNFETIKDKINYKDEIDTSLSKKSSMKLVKNKLSKINFIDYIINPRQLPKNKHVDKHEEDKYIVKDISADCPFKISDESKQILDEYMKEIAKKSIGIDEIIDKNINPLKITGCDFFTRYCLCKKKYFDKKFQPFKLAEKNLNFNLDISTYLQKMNEFEILKTILFDNDLKVLMEFISKPIIACEDQDESKMLFEKEIFNYLTGRNFINHNNQINKETLENINISYQNIRNSLIGNQNNNKINEAQYKKKVENYFEKQIEFLFYDC